MGAVYRTNGYALAGTITRPFNEQIDVQAALIGHTDGGHAAVSAANFNHKHIVSFNSAAIHSAGSHDPADDCHHSVISARVEGLNVLNVLTVDRIVARINCKHPPSPKSQTPKSTKLPDVEPLMLPFGAHIEGLKIAGCPVDIQFDCDLLGKHATWQDIVDHCKPTPKPEPGAPFVCSLVKNVVSACPGVNWNPKTGALEVKDFGNIFLARLVLEPSRRWLTMLQLELGSAVQLVARVGSIENNNVCTTCPPCC
jgi:hypothetical protein